jgi:signal transduction histidine kinase
MDTSTDAHQHSVQFYDDDTFLSPAIATFVAEGLRVGQPVIVLATADHANLIAASLQDHGYTFDSVRASGELLYIDAAEALSLFMRDGVPDSELFDATLGRLVADRVQTHPGTGVRAYGEMVDVLWREGNGEGALAVEELWNRLAEQHAFALLCAYCIGNFYKVSDAEYFDRICAAHQHVIPTERFTALDAQAQARHVTRLEQRALALETEIRERRQVEQQLRESLQERVRADAALRDAASRVEEAHRVKSDFLAVMSHELRTPLNAIIGYDDLLAAGIPGPVTPEQQLYISRIRSGAEHLVQLIDQILALAHVESGGADLALETVDLREVVNDAMMRIAPAAAARGLLAETALPPEPCTCCVDVGKVRQIVLNLLSNAVKFTEAGVIRVAVHCTDSAVTVEVQDTGPGIDAADHERIFDRFVQLDATATRRFGGAGVGLAIARDFARMLGGDVTLASVPGAGSIFTLCLPIRAFPYQPSATA